MEFINSEDVPKLNYYNIKEIQSKLKQLEQKKREIEKTSMEIKLSYAFKDFWLLCDSPIPVTFKYHNILYITHDKTKIKGGEENNGNKNGVYRKRKHT